MIRLPAFKLLLAATLLSSCAVDPFSQRDISGDSSNKSLLDALKGPDVKGVEKTLLESAEKSAEKGDFARSAQFYEQLVDQYPEKTEYKVSIADVKRRAGRMDEAITDFEAIIAKEPGNAAALEGKGLALLSKGDFEKAGTVLSAAMKADPGRWRTLNGIGILFTMKGMSDEAIQYYNQALRVGENNPSVLNNMGLTYALDKDYFTASQKLEEAHQRAATGSPEKKRYAFNLALVYGLSERMEEASAILNPYLPKEAIDNNLGYYASIANNDKLAKSYLNMALSHSPTYYEKAWQNLDAISGGSADASKKKGKSIKVKEEDKGAVAEKRVEKKKKKVEETVVKEEKPVAPEKVEKAAVKEDKNEPLPDLFAEQEKNAKEEPKPEVSSEAKKEESVKKEKTKADESADAEKEVKSEKLEPEVEEQAEEKVEEKKEEKAAVPPLKIPDDVKAEETNSDEPVLDSDEDDKQAAPKDEPSSEKEKDKAVEKDETSAPQAKDGESKKEETKKEETKKEDSQSQSFFDSLFSSPPKHVKEEIARREKEGSSFSTIFTKKPVVTFEKDVPAEIKDAEPAAGKSAEDNKAAERKSPQENSSEIEEIETDKGVNLWPF